MSLAFRRIAVVGCSGGGKSTLSIALGERLGLPVIPLDLHFWQAGWVEPEVEDWRRRFAQLASQPAWVMDGTFMSTIDAKLAAADLVIDIDLPRLLCLYRVLVRWVRFWGRTRPDMAPGCPEKVDWDFVTYIWSFPKQCRPRLEQAEAEAGKCVIRLRSTAQIAEFTAGLPATLNNLQ